MPTEIPATPYEVYCAQCQVTFPIGTKRCIHCGNRISRFRGTQSVVVPSTLEAGGGAENPDFSGDEEILSRSRRVSPMSILWILAAVAVAVQRACAN